MKLKKTNYKKDATDIYANAKEKSKKIKHKISVCFICFFHSFHCIKKKQQINYAN
jgi:hypothetical protein